MTKEENIATLIEHLDHWKRLLYEKICDQDEGEKTIDALQNAIKALEQEPCTDAISRQAAIVALDDRMSSLENVDMQIAMGFAKGIIHELPPVTPQHKMGRWINAKVGKMFPSNDYKCSECGNILDFDGVNCGRGDANYCPNCGCKMSEVEG